MARHAPAEQEDDGVRASRSAGTHAPAAPTAGRREAARDNVAFFIAGLMNTLFYFVYVSAAEDLLRNSAGVVLLCDTLPGLLVKTTFPFVADSFSFGFRVSLTTLGLCAACLSVGLVAATPVRLAGICLSSCAGALGEITFLALSSQYRPSTVGAWSAGTGFAGLSGSFIYHFMRAGLGATSRQAILLVAPLSLAMLASYTFVLTPARGDGAYAPIPVTEDARGDASSASGSAAGCEGGDDSAAPGYEPVEFDSVPPGMSLRRAAFPWLLQSYILPLMLVYFFEFVINQGISPTLDMFTSDAGKPGLAQPDRTHLYTSFQTAYQSGAFISRSSIEFVKFPRIWLLPFVQFCNFLLLLTGALFRFLPHRYVVFCVMFFEGLVGGVVYVNAFYKLRKTAPSELKAWALGAASVGDTLGITFAACVNIFLECGIRRLRGESSCETSK